MLYEVITDWKSLEAACYALVRAENSGDRVLVNIAYDNSRQSSVTVFNSLAAMP